MIVVAVVVVVVIAVRVVVVVVVAAMVVVVLVHIVTAIPRHLKNNYKLRGNSLLSHHLLPTHNSDEERIW